MRTRRSASLPVGAKLSVCSPTEHLGISLCVMETKRKLTAMNKSDLGRGAARPSRKLPMRGVWSVSGEPTIVFITVCTKDREAWLASDEYHRLLRAVWRDADAWFVGRYVIMPDHLHFFASPGSRETDLSKWIAFWKHQVTLHHRETTRRWQKSFWDTRMRSQRNYHEKWDYVRDNPVRRGLVSAADDWPYQGEVFNLLW